jgi:hypothetical protein
MLPAACRYLVRFVQPPKPIGNKVMAHTRLWMYCNIPWSHPIAPSPSSKFPTTISDSRFSIVSA